MAPTKTHRSSQRSGRRKTSAKSASRPSAKRSGTAAPKRAPSKGVANSRAAAKSRGAPTKSRSSAKPRRGARVTPRASRPATKSRSLMQGGLLDPMAWLASLETTLASPQSRAVMAQALRAVADVLEGAPGQDEESGETRPSRGAVSAAGSLGAEMMAAPLQVAAAAIGAAGEVVSSALGGSSSEGRSEQ